MVSLMNDYELRVLAVRHGQTEWNVARRVQGHTDVPLNARGQAQARELARTLAETPEDRPTVIFSADLQRARRTAEIVQEATGARLQFDAGLRERGFGKLEGMNIEAIGRELPEIARRWRERDLDWTPEGGESLRTLIDRVARTSQLLLSGVEREGTIVLFVTHGGVLDVLYRLAACADWQTPSAWKADNCAINRLAYTGNGWRLIDWSGVRRQTTSDMP